MNCILVGYGEIGRAVKDVFGQAHNIDTYDITDKGKPPAKSYDILLACFPYSEIFETEAQHYQNRFNTKATIIFSTVAIGTTRKIPGAVHSPVEGKHPNLAESIKIMPRWVGGFGKLVDQFFTEAGFKPKYVTPETTEFLKLQSTSNYGLMIEYARYVKSVCDQLGINYAHVKDFNLDYNILYRKMGMSKYQRYILDPPEGNLGGHCVTPNARMLDSQYPSLFLREIYRDKEGERK